MALTATVAVVAFAVRLRVATNPAGLHALQGYDDGVYYAAADSLVHGRLPYRDFVLLHPPGIALALAPFAALGRATSDSLALAVGRVAFMAVGAVNAALVYRLARRCGPGPSVVAGLLYAVWYPAAYAERSTLLEPLGTLTLLVALLLLRPGAGRWAQVGAGGALGACLAVKIWDVVPVLVVACWLSVTAGRRAVQRLVVAAGAVAALIYLPFLLAAPTQLPRMVVLDQLRRPVAAGGRLLRVPSLTGLTPLAPHLGHRTVVALAAAATVVVAGCTVSALRTRGARLWGVLVVACTGVVLAAPTYFLHYAGFVAAPVALVVGVGVGRAAGVCPGFRVPSRRRAAVVAVPTVAALVALTAVTAGVRTGERFPAAAFARAVSGRRCVVSDNPTTLALMDVLSRDLDGGCRLMVDVSGLTYDRDAARLPDGSGVPRRKNQRWQHDLLGYLIAGSAAVIARDGSDGFSPATRRRLRRLPMLARAGDVVLRGRS